jgi:hypothetical protein
MQLPYEGPLTLKALAPVLIHPLTFSPEDRLDQLTAQISASGDPTTFAWLDMMKARLPHNPYHQTCLEFCTRRVREAGKIPWWEPYDTAEEEFFSHQPQAFLNNNTALKKELDALAMPLEVRVRVEELCFISGLVFSVCLWLVQWSGQARKRVIQVQKSLRSLPQKTAQNPVVSPDQKYAALTEFLQTVYRPDVQTFRKSLGIDKAMNGPAPRHKIWTTVFMELVDLLQWRKCGARLARPETRLRVLLPERQHAPTL